MALQKTCKKCNDQFTCGPQAESNKCWCQSLPPLKTIPKIYDDCLCPNCLKAYAKHEQDTRQSGFLTPQKDYYLEEGTLVFTEAYHLHRGYCCESGCRHCPYGFRSKA